MIEWLGRCSDTVGLWLFRRLVKFTYNIYVSPSQPYTINNWGLGDLALQGRLGSSSISLHGDLRLPWDSCGTRTVFLGRTGGNCHLPALLWLQHSPSLPYTVSVTVITVVITSDSLLSIFIPSTYLKDTKKTLKLSNLPVLYYFLWRIKLYQTIN